MDRLLTRDLKAFWITSALVCLVLVVKSYLEGTLGQIGPDSDDTMRLVQVRDFLAGQSWFDLSQYRMGPDGGTLMHWSRIADLPLILLISFFDLFFPAVIAEAIAISIWPLMCAVLTLYGVLVGIRHLSKGTSIWASCLLLGLILVGYSRFMPGSIDHHNFQLALIAIALGHALDPQLRSKSYIISAIAMSLSLAIGPEVYFFIAVLCGFFALQWLFNPIPARSAVLAMSVTFAAMVTVIFLLTTAPMNYGVVTCDSYSVITFAACLAGGLGLAVIVVFMSEKPMTYRLLILGSLGVICALIFLAQAPQCLSNPLDVLPDDVRQQWLGKIQEAQPLFRNSDEWLTRVPYALGPMVVAIIILIGQVRAKINTAQSALILALLIITTALMIYQIRFIAFGHIFAIFALGPWIAALHQKGKSSGGANTLYLGALAASLPVVWAAPGVLMGAKSENPMETIGQIGACYSEEVFTALNALQPGLVIAMENDTPVLLRQTHHRVLTGNYHRNVEGIADGLSILKNPPEAARSILNKHKADYFLYCDITMANSEFVTNYPQSLTAQIAKKAIPNYLDIIREDLEGGGVRIYRIKR